MYLDYVLFAVSIVLLLSAVILAVFLFTSRKQWREYHRFLTEETQSIDIITSLRSTQPLEPEQVRTEPLTRPLTEPLTEPLRTVPGTVRLTQETEPLDSDASDQTWEMQPETSSLAETLIDKGLDLSRLNEKYSLIREIHGGGMSQIFLAKHKKLGNEWIVKFIDGNQAELANEAEVLKKLNHISLPQIIDIFPNSQGTFLVERYIEGYPLNEVLKLGEKLTESQVIEWGLQLVQVLNYLHNLEIPIIHCDLKPSNIMVTHDNRLVLIDFGISKRQGVSEKTLGLTYRYAAPEQFRGKADRPDAIFERFGFLPPEHSAWPIDQRTDLYSVGVILYELVMGKIPEKGRFEDIRQWATPRLAGIICKCLEIQPERRFQSAEELIQAFQEAAEQRLSMSKKLVMRRVAAVCSGVFLAGGLVTSSSGIYVNRMENLAIVSMDPGKAVVTMQQSVQILVQKAGQNGKTVTLDPHKITWSYSEENIARLDGDRLVGLNIGQTTLYGKYRNKIITLDITVMEPVNEQTAVALRYAGEAQVQLYAGSGIREQRDGTLLDCSFVSPECMSRDGDVLWLTDSGVIRRIEGTKVSTLHLEPDYLTADLVRGCHGELYVRTGPWEGEDGTSYYGLLRIGEEGAEFLYYTEAVWSVITDFAFSSDGVLWFLQQNMSTGLTSLFTLDVDTLDCAWVMDLPAGAQNMSFDESDTLYISVPESGVILRVGQGESSWTYFAGVEGERHFVDGAIPNFYRPTALAAEGNTLYVLDFDTVRKITVEGEGALFTETVAGIPVEDTNPAVVLGVGAETVLPASEMASLILGQGGDLLLSDPKNSLVYQIVALR